MSRGEKKVSRPKPAVGKRVGLRTEALSLGGLVVACDGERGKGDRIRAYFAQLRTCESGHVIILSALLPRVRHDHTSHMLFTARGGGEAGRECCLDCALLGGHHYPTD